MILRRLSKHVNDQNWFAVVLDFFIVVVGVYIGVLLGNWNETGQQRSLYGQSYDRMIVELEDNVRSLEGMHEALEEPLGTVQLALDDIRACRSGEEAMAHVQASFAPLGLSFSLSINTVALDQLINNDAFLSFQSPEHRNRLLNLASELKYIREASDRVAIESNKAELDEGLTEKGPLSYSGPAEIIDVLTKGGARSPEIVRPTRLKVPLSEACKNESFLAHYYAWEDNVYYQSVFSAMHAKQLRAELKALGHLMEKTDPASNAEAAP